MQLWSQIRIRTTIQSTRASSLLFLVQVDRDGTVDCRPSLESSLRSGNGSFIRSLAGRNGIAHAPLLFSNATSRGERPFFGFSSVVVHPFGRMTCNSTSLLPWLSFPSPKNNGPFRPYTWTTRPLQSRTPRDSTYIARPCSYGTRTPNHAL